MKTCKRQTNKELRLIFLMGGVYRLPNTDQLPYKIQVLVRIQ